MRASLQSEIAAFLVAHGPATAKQVALGVRARRADVDAALVSDAFTVVQRPEGANPRSVYYAVSRRVLSSRGRSSRRADLLHRLLADGLPHPRWACRAAAGDYTNNAAKELRDRGFDVRYDRKTDTYQLFAEPGVRSAA